MKSIIGFYFLVLLTIFITNVFSYSSSSHQTRLYNLLRRPLGKKADMIALTSDKDKQATNRQVSSDEYDDQVQSRHAWDSGEDYYFQWANQNRRPVEYLAGRKREAEKAVLPPRDRRINGGLWRSGLVG